MSLHELRKAQTFYMPVICWRRRQFTGKSGYLGSYLGALFVEAFGLRAGSTSAARHRSPSQEDRS